MNRETVVDLAEMSKINALKSTESDWIGKPGYKRIERPNGGYDWTYDFRPNVDGKITKEGGEVMEAMRPFAKADTERHSRMQAQVEQVTVRDASGQLRQLDATLAEDTARQNGWSHHWHAGGLRVERGIQGMLFREWKGEWQPTGKLQIGINGKSAPRRGIQLDPNGVPWRFIDGCWVKL